MWSDNETSTDLLGFQHLVSALTTIVRDDRLLPATLGVFGDWGGGKSSLLRMAKAELEKDGSVLVLTFNGWLFEGFEDAKSALMGTILDELAANKRFVPAVKEKALNLLKKVDWFRLLGTAGKYGLGWALGGPVGLGLAAGTDAAAATAQTLTKAKELEVDQLAKLIRPEGGPELRRAVREFRDDFADLLAETKLKTLVVIIDDLDRCLPDTIIETLEAIKLFLFVPRTAFILGADERLVKYAVRKRFPELPGQNVEVGRDYLEKLIQFPIHIPPLNASELETFINLLFVDAAGLDAEQREQARQRAVCDGAAAIEGVRFSYGVAKELFDPVPRELTEGMDLAQRIAPVLTERFTGNPRQCKRFLNTLLMRLEMAASRKLTLNRSVLAKLMLLEYYKPEWFKRLAELQVSQGGQPQELPLLEKAAPRPAMSTGDNGQAGKGTGTVKGTQAPLPMVAVPEEFTAWLADVWTRSWLESAPQLGGTDLRPYFYFSRDILGPLGGAVRRLSPQAQEVLQKLLHDSEAQRLVAGKEAAKLSPADAAAVLEAVCERVSREDTPDLERPPLAGLLVLADGVTELRGQVVTFFSKLPEPRIPLGVPVKLAALGSGGSLTPATRQVLDRWAAGKANAPLARAAKAALKRLK